MITKVLPNKIALKINKRHAVWDLIKFAVVRVDNVKEESRGRYLNKLLQSLLNGETQCFIREDKNVGVKSVFLSKIIYSKVTKEKKLLIQSYYAFKMSDDGEWRETLDFIKDFAVKEGCHKVVFKSINPKIIDRAVGYGYVEEYRKFYLDTGVKDVRI